MDPLLRDLRGVYDELAQHRKQVTQLMSSVKRCMGKVERRLARAPRRNVTSGGGESAPASVPRANGLTKPFPVSSSLCTFMDVPHGTQLARAEVTKYLHNYIRTKNLYDSTNRQYIIPDTNLKTLLNIPDTESADAARMHIFSMQQKMNTHFVYPGKPSQ